MFYSVDSPGVFLHGRFKSSMNQAVSTECSLEGASSPPGGAVSQWQCGSPTCSDISPYINTYVQVLFVHVCV